MRDARNFQYVSLFLSFVLSLVSSVPLRLSREICSARRFLRRVKTILKASRTDDNFSGAENYKGPSTIFQT